MAVQSFTNAAREVSRDVGFLHDRQALLLHFVQQRYICAVTRRKNHRDVGALDAHARVSLRAIHLGHHDVEQEQVNAVPLLVKFADGLLAVARQNHVIAEIGKRLARQFAQPFVIFGDKNRFRTAANRTSLFNNGCCFYG